MELQAIQNRIFEIRDQQVMFDFDLAELYEVETKVFNQAVKRNLDSFPDDFMFQLTESEWKDKWAQEITGSQRKRNTMFLPYVFTEHGVTMLASVLKSPRARMMNIAIVRAFIALRKFVIQHQEIVSQLAELEKKVGVHDKHLNKIYAAIEALLKKKNEDEFKWQRERKRIGFKE